MKDLKYSAGNKGLIEKIRRLKERRNAVILAHNYQIPEIQDIADYRGDSLALSQQAAQTASEVIVFCGVHFMAETAAVLSPDKKVLLPALNAGCPMAEMITAEKLRELKAKHPTATVVCYVNTTAEVKAESDICCTSANVVKVFQTLPEDQSIIFVPDKYLGQYAASKTHREVIYWPGYCPVHLKILASDIIRQKKEHPRAEVIVHPECTPDVIALADGVFSTSGMCQYAQKTSSEEIIVGTEVGLLYRLRKENPDKKFYPASELAVCENMKLNTLTNLSEALEEMKNEVKIDEEIRIKAKKSIERMLEVT
jgi:quinolinate synthase